MPSLEKGFLSLSYIYMVDFYGVQFWEVHVAHVANSVSVKEALTI